MGEVAAQRLQLGERLLAPQAGEPLRRQALHHLEKGRETAGVSGALRHLGRRSVRAVYSTFWHFWTLSSPVSAVCSAERMYLFRVLSRARSFRQEMDKMPSHIKILPSNYDRRKQD